MHFWCCAKLQLMRRDLCFTEINDSGVYLPPSPTERKSFWGTTSSRSTTSSSINRCAFDENEPFNISRESFDSYRRSFVRSTNLNCYATLERKRGNLLGSQDISARSPIIQPDSRGGRTSLDSRTFLPPPRLSNSFSRGLSVPPQTQEEEVVDKFEDVAIDDPKPPPPQKKRGILARIVDSTGGDHDSGTRPTSSHESNNKSSAWHHFGGRKRGQSGQGAELGSIVPKREETPKPEKQQQSQTTTILPAAVAQPSQLKSTPQALPVAQPVAPLQQQQKPLQQTQSPAQQPTAAPEPKQMQSTAKPPTQPAPPTQPTPPRKVENIPPPKDVATKKQTENPPATVAAPPIAAAAPPPAAAAAVEIKVDS